MTEYHYVADPPEKDPYLRHPDELNISTRSPLAKAKSLGVQLCGPDGCEIRATAEVRKDGIHVLQRICFDTSRDDGYSHSVRFPTYRRAPIARRTSREPNRYRALVMRGPQTICEEVTANEIEATLQSNGGSPRHFRRVPTPPGLRAA